MIYLLDNWDYNPLFYILIILLIVVVIAIFYLVYTQHKEMLKVLGKKEEKVIKGTKEDLTLENTKTNFELPVLKVENEIELINDNNEIVDNNDSKYMETPTEDIIPDKFDYTKALWQKDDIDLEELSRELKSYPEERKIIASKYEEEMEEQAIISYDELLEQSKKKESFELPKVKKEYNSENYEHEENFLRDLKSLNERLK